MPRSCRVVLGWMVSLILGCTTVGCAQLPGIDDLQRDHALLFGDLADIRARFKTVEADLTILKAKTQSLRKPGHPPLRLPRVHAFDRLHILFPNLAGTVRQVDLDGKLLTIQRTDGPNGTELKAGDSLAIFRGTTFKGEAMATSCKGKLMFCRMESLVEDGTVEIGDEAKTIPKR